MTTDSFKDLQTRGFLVIPSFLSDAEVEEFRADFSRQEPGAIANYNHSAASDHANERLKQRVQDVLAQVRQGTDLCVDFTWAGIYFATGRGINFPWHQDHEAYFSFQNHYDYLNFYIPIVKPCRDKSNLSIIPFDVLEKESPKIFRKVVRHGASRFVPLGSKGLVFLDDRGTVHLMDRNIERMAHTPMLGVGDLLLLRGDMIHKTQDTDTERVALSFRASSSKALVRRAHLADGGLYKARMMARNAGVSQVMFMAFDAAKKDEMEAHELLDLMRTVKLERPKKSREFMRYLLAEKRRARVLGRFIPSVIMGAMAGQFASMYQRYRGWARA
jgi:hypothetical protein